MKADSLRISKVFSSGGDVHYVLPYFQREYAWEKEHWQTLLEDVLDVYEVYHPEKEPEHFMGSLVVINDGTRNGTIPAFKLVDGQQRLTTISLALCALGRLVKATHPQIARRIQRLLMNLDEEGDLRFKVLPTPKYGDRAAYLAILQEESLPTVDSKVPQAFEFLYKRLEYAISQEKADPERLFLVLTNCLQVVFIDLDQKERPYEIFESLNHKGKRLSQADLVRNYIAMKLPESRQEEAFEKHWSKIEAVLQERRTVGRSRLGELTAFLRHYLAMHSGALCREDNVYERFRDRMEKEFPDTAAFVGELKALQRFSVHYDRLLRPDTERDSDVRAALIRLNVLEVSTAYPFLLTVYDAVHSGKLARLEFLEGLQILENYIVRRYLAGEQTNYMNKMFAALRKDIDFDRFPASVREALSTRRYPSDERVRHGVLTEEFYGRNAQVREKTTLILETINRRLSAGAGGYTILDAAPTIEHIMPQNPDQTWKGELGSDWPRIHQEYLHTLGNLTLVTQGWNTQLSNARFAEKKIKLAAHEFRLNRDYFSRSIPKWNENAIRARAEFLAEKVREIWPSFAPATTQPSPVSHRPKALVLLGDTFPVQSWRDAAYQTAEWVNQLTDDFDTIVEQIPTYFSKQESRPASRQLSSGWWIYLNLSGDAARRLCRRLVAAAGIAEDDYQIEEE